MHLKMRVFERIKELQEFNYFDIRHVVREYGDSKGIFFAGKSGADTISLDSAVSPKGQQQVILDWFKTTNKSKNREDIAKIIRGGSLNHASFYINELITNGDLVHITKGQYAIPEIAFKDVPVKDVMKITESIVIKAMRPVDVGVISEECNTRLHISKPKTWYVSLIRFHCREQHSTWDFFHSLISIVPINGMSIQECVRQLITQVETDEQLIDGVLQRVLAHKQTIKKVINEVRSQSL